MVQSILIIFEQAFLYFPLVLGAYISISLMKLPDLSIEGAYVFGAILASQFLIVGQGLPNSVHMILVFCVSMLGGLLVGIISGSLTRFAHIPHLLSSILTIGLFHGINQFVLRTTNLSLSTFQNPLSSLALLIKNPELPILALVFIVLVIAGYFFLKTQLGYSLAVFGNNPRFFENYGISTTYVCMWGIVIANALAGLSGYFVAQSSGFVDVNAGFGMALFCLTSLILGKAFLFTKKPFSIWIPINGTLAYCTIQQLLLKVGFNLKYFTMIQSVLVLLILIKKYRKIGKRGTIADNLGV